MILMIGGSSHTGKTLAAQRVLERYAYPYLSIDHLKMGLIRSGICPLTPESPDAELTPYLWNIVKEMMKTAIENHQNLVVEGCYIPFDWEKNFDPFYRAQIRFVCLVFSEEYIQENYHAIMDYANVIEQRVGDDSCTQELLLRENRENLAKCRQYGCKAILIDETYRIDIEEFGCKQGLSADTPIFWEEIPMNNEKVYAMGFSKLYPMLVSKAVNKGRTRAEVDEVIRWLTGYSQSELEGLARSDIAYGDFFQNAPALNPNRALITGSVCGVKLAEIEEPLMREIRYLDKLVDELAKGKAMEKILRG